MSRCVLLSFLFLIILKRESMLDPEELAALMRKRVAKDSRYLLAKIAGSGQAPGERKILNEFFRYKDYLDPAENEDWFAASLEEVWSPKFLGLRENFRELPLERVKKLEFQNPPYSAAYRLKGKQGDPREYTKVFTLQIAACNYDCNYCYVPRVLKTCYPEFSRYFTAREIVENFLRCRESMPLNVLRISGGEPLAIVPEMVIDIYAELESRSLCEEVYLWVDTNLSTSRFMERVEGDLKSVLSKRNVGVVGCFKGVNERDFSLLTGAREEFYDCQFETAKLLLSWKCDFYCYLPALVYGDRIEEKLREFIERQRELNRHLPLRTEVIVILPYPAMKVNAERCAKSGRSLPKTDQRDVLDAWYNRLLPEFYDARMLSLYCCEVEL